MLLELRTQTIVSLVTEELKAQETSVQMMTTAGVARIPEESETAAHLQAMAETEFADNPDALERSKHVNYLGLAHAIHDGAKAFMHNLRTSSRVSGLDVELSFVLASLVNYVAPIFLVAIGQPAIAAAVLAFPGGTAFGALYTAIKEILHHGRTVALYGGHKNYRYQINLENAVRKKLHLHRDTDLYFAIKTAGSPTSSDEGSVILSNDGALQDVLEFLHLKKERLSYHDLKKIAREHGLTKAERKTLESDESDKSMRASVIFSWIEEHLSPEDFAAVKRKYSEGFVSATHEPEIAALNQWAGQAIDVKTCDQLAAYVNKVPEGIRVPYIADTWYRVIVPSLADTLDGVTIGKVHRMVEASQDFSILGRLSVHENWNAAWSDKLDELVTHMCK